MKRSFVPLLVLGLVAGGVIGHGRALAANQPADSTRAAPADSVPDPALHVREPDLVVSNQAGKKEPNRFHIRLQLLRFGLTGVYDTNIDHNLADTNSHGFIGHLQGLIRTNPRPPYAWFGYDGGYQAFSSSTMWDRWEHQAELGARIPLHDTWSFVASGDYDDRLASEDRYIVNQFTATPQLRYDLKRFGARAYGTYRWRIYENRPLYDEKIWMAGSELRVNPGRRNIVRLGYRHEDATSDTPSRSYTRERLQLSDEIHLGRHHTFNLQGEHQWRSYPLDMVDTGSTTVSREDRRWIAGASYVLSLPWRQDLVLDYEFEQRISNDPKEEYVAHRVELGMRWTLLK